MATDKRLEAVLGVALRNALRQLHTLIPGQVVKVNVVGGNVRSVNVQPLLKDTTADEDGDLSEIRLPVVNDVPIVQPGAGGFRATFPVKEGDTVLLAVSERSLDNWKATGGEVLPTKTHQHQLTDAVAILGLNDFAHALASAPADKMTLGSDTGMQIHLTETEVKLGGDAATQSAICGDAYRTAEDVFFAAIASAFSGLGVTPFATAKSTFDAAAATYKSTTVKVKP